MKQLTSEEKQMLQNLLHPFYEKVQNDIESIKNFKWLCNVPQSGEAYEKHKIVWDLQNKAVKEHNEYYHKVKELINRITG